MAKECKKCGDIIPSSVVIEGKLRNLQSRKFCLTCSPFGKHNTRDVTKPKNTWWKKYARYRANLKWKLVKHKGGVCIKCGYNKSYPSAFVFHHRNPAEKEFGISAAISQGVGLERLIKEVDKCDLLCVLCHAETHDDERNLSA